MGWMKDGSFHNGLGLGAFCATRARIITKRRHTGNGKSIQRAAPFPVYTLSSNVHVMECIT
jgi:hypothetical protein